MFVVQKAHWIGITLIVLAGSAAARPAWIDQRGNPALEMSYLQGVGSCMATGDPAADQRKADDAARAEIARQIQVEIQSVFTSEIQEQVEIKSAPKGKGREQVDREMSSRVTDWTQSRVKLSLTGIEIRAQYFDKKERVYYAWAVLDRDRSLQQWRVEEEVHLKAAEQARDRYGLLEGVRAGAEWARHAMEAASLEQLCSAVASEPDFEWPGAYLLTEAIGGLRTILQDVRMSPQEALPSGVFGDSLSEPMQVALHYRGHPAPGVQARFRFLRGRGLLGGSGSRGEQITVGTDSQGITVCRVEEIRSVTDRNVVAAALDTSRWGLPTGLPLPQCEVVFPSVLHPTARAQGLHFSLEGSSSEQIFQDGQEIQFTATTNRDGALHLFLIDASGRLKYLTSKQLDRPEATPSWSIEQHGTGWRFTFPIVIHASSGRGLETLVGLWTVPGVRIGQPGQVYLPGVCRCI